MEISGPRAAEMYRRLGPSVQENDVCGDSDMENRRRGEVDCTRTKSSGTVTCHVNFDLRTGKVWGAGRSSGSSPTKLGRRRGTTSSPCLRVHEPGLAMRRHR